MKLTKQTKIDIIIYALSKKTGKSVGFSNLSKAKMEDIDALALKYDVDMEAEYPAFTEYQKKKGEELAKAFEEKKLRDAKKIEEINERSRLEKEKEREEIKIKKERYDALDDWKKDIIIKKREYLQYQEFLKHYHHEWVAKNMQMKKMEERGVRCIDNPDADEIGFMANGMIILGEFSNHQVHHYYPVEEIYRNEFAMEMVEELEKKKRIVVKRKRV